MPGRLFWLANAHTPEGIFVQPPRFGNPDVELLHGVVSQVFSDATEVDGNCFAMVSMVTGQPEEMVYATCPANGTDGSTRIVHLVASDSIASRLQAEGADAARRIRAIKTEAFLSDAEGAAFRRAWLRALGRAEIQTGFPLQREVWREFFFSTYHPGLFQGAVGAFSQNPASGTTAKRLVELAQILASVADLGDQHRVERVSLLAQATALAKAIE